MIDYFELDTEKINEKSVGIDKLPTLGILKLINDEDKTVAFAVEAVLPEIAEAVDATVERLRQGGRLFYIGAGTSGRLGILDASECPPTYGVSPELVTGVIAGGKEAVFRSIEGAEDDPDAAVRDLDAAGFSAKDVCFAISASGSARYCQSALAYANSIGAYTAALSCTKKSPMAALANTAILPETGAEVISGSTRMKAGTAQKMVLNMVSTGVMIKLGRVSGNRMVCMNPVNKKLRVRAVKMICDASGAGEDAALSALEAAGGNIKKAIESLKNA